MHTVVAESWVTLDTGLLGENIIVLSLKVTDDFAKAVTLLALNGSAWLALSYLASLSI
jgi:hypothetical protein